MIRSMRHLAAFSLIELVMVLVIVAIVAAIAVPRYFNAIARYRADAAAGRIVADLELARASARTAGLSRTVTFDLAAGAMTISDVTPLNRIGLTYRTDFTAEPYRATLIAADFNGDAILIFDGFGQADSAGTITVRCASHQRTITLDPTTGEGTITP